MPSIFDGNIHDDPFSAEEARVGAQVSSLFSPGTTLLEIALRTSVIYIFVLVGFRLTGKREIGQFTLFDLVLILLVANAVQTAMVGPDTSLVGGLLSASVLIGMNYVVGLVAGRVPWVHRLLVGQATQLIADGKILTDNMRREGVDDDDLLQALHEHELQNPSQAAAAWLETDGTISVVPRGRPGQHSRRRVRQVKHGG
jgi:uncharacterized membrane protein YcaP (DUF421 family)